MTKRKCREIFTVGVSVNSLYIHTLVGNLIEIPNSSTFGCCLLGLVWLPMLFSF